MAKSGEITWLGSIDNLGRYEEAIELFQLALDSDFKNFGEDHPKGGPKKNNLGGGISGWADMRKRSKKLYKLLDSDLLIIFG